MYRWICKTSVLHSAIDDKFFACDEDVPREHLASDERIKQFCAAGALERYESTPVEPEATPEPEPVDPPKRKRGRPRKKGK
jgi:hypothetical protein